MNAFLATPLESPLRKKMETPLRGIQVFTKDFPFMFAATIFDQGGPDLYSGNILTARYSNIGQGNPPSVFPALQWDTSFVDYLLPMGVPGKHPLSWTIWYSVYKYVNGGTFFTEDTPPAEDAYQGITPDSYETIKGFCVFPTTSDDFGPEPVNPPIVGHSKKGASIWIGPSIQCSVSKHTIHEGNADPSLILLNVAAPGDVVESIVPTPDDGNYLPYDGLRCTADHVLIMWIGLTPDDLPKAPFTPTSKTLFVLGDPNLV